MPPEGGHEVAERPEANAEAGISDAGAFLEPRPASRFDQHAGIIAITQRDDYRWYVTVARYVIGSLSSGPPKTQLCARNFRF